MKRADINQASRVIGKVLLSVAGRKSKVDMRLSFAKDAKKFYPIHKYYVAEDKGKIIGALGTWTMRAHYPRVAWLGWFGVDKEHQRKGVGSAMLAAAFRDMRRRGVRIVNVETSQIAKEAIAFYRKHGFRLMGRIPRFWSQKEDWLVYSRRI
jgi:ribosomal protein S18 acetylase RimI-like enzyme